MDSNSQIICSDIDAAFNENICLPRLIVPEHIRTTLMTWIDYHYSQSHQSRRIGAVMLSGKTSTTVARALSNSFGNNAFKYIEGAHLGNGMGFSDYYLGCDDLTTYFVHSVEHCNNYVLFELSQLIRENIVRAPEIIGLKKEQIYPFNRLLIFSTAELILCDENLLDSVDLVIDKWNYTQQETTAILQQRLNLMKWSCDDTNIVDLIVSKSDGNIKLALNLLKWSFRCCMARGDDRLQIRDLNSALHILM